MEEKQYYCPKCKKFPNAIREYTRGTEQRVWDGDCYELKGTVDTETISIQCEDCGTYVVEDSPPIRLPDNFRNTSVSKATHITNDIKLAMDNFIADNHTILPQVYKDEWEDYCRIFEKARDNKNEEDMSSVLNEDMFDFFSEIAPRYCYFGAHEGDGSDFGFWLHDMPITLQIDTKKYVSWFVENNDETVYDIAKQAMLHGYRPFYEYVKTGRDLFEMIPFVSNVCIYNLDEIANKLELEDDYEIKIEDIPDIDNITIKWI